MNDRREVGDEDDADQVHAWRQRNPNTPLAVERMEPAGGGRKPAGVLRNGVCAGPVDTEDSEYRPMLAGRTSVRPRHG